MYQVACDQEGKGDFAPLQGQPWQEALPNGNRLLTQDYLPAATGKTGETSQGRP